MIRALGPEDLTAFRALWLEGLRRDPAAFLLTPAEAAAMPDAALLDGLQDSRHFGAFDAARLVGLASCKRGGVARLRHMADLGPVYVTPDARRRGLARAMVEAAIAHQRGQGVLQIELCVDAANAAAVALYERLGFVRIGLRPRSVIVDAMPRDDLLMLRKLDA